MQPRRAFEPDPQPLNLPQDPMPIQPVGPAFSSAFCAGWSRVKAGKDGRFALREEREFRGDARLDVQFQLRLARAVGRGRRQGVYQA